MGHSQGSRLSALGQPLCHFTRSSFQIRVRHLLLEGPCLRELLRKLTPCWEQVNYWGTIGSTLIYTSKPEIGEKRNAGPSDSLYSL